MTGQCQCQVVEQLAHTGFAHNSAKKDEEEDVAGSNVNRGAINTFRISKEMVGKAGPIIAAVHEHARHGTTKNAIGYENQAQQGKHIAADATGGFQNQGHQQRRHRHIHSVGITSSFNKALIVGGNINGSCQGSGYQNPVQNGRSREAGFLTHGVHEEG